MSGLYEEVERTAIGSLPIDMVMFFSKVQPVWLREEERVEGKECQRADPSTLL